MKIAMVTQTFNRIANGAGVFTVQLAEGLAQHGHQVLVMAPQGSHPDQHAQTIPGLQVVPIRSFSLAPFYPNVRAALFASGPVGRVLDEYIPDLVHIHDHYPLSASTARLASRRDIPLLASNNFLPDNIIQNVTLFQRYSRLVIPILWKTVLDVFNQANLITTPTETAAEILRGVHPRPPVVPVSCGIDRSRFRVLPGINQADMRRRYQLDPRKTTFLYVGRLDNEKRVDVLIRAFAKAQRDDMQLAIGGKGLNAEQLKALAHHLDLNDTVRFLGFIPEEDLVPLLNSVDYFAMPGDTELQSLATLEAMACGRPVLGADARALPELVKHQYNGYLFRANDPQSAAQGLLWLADQKKNWPMLSAASLATAAPHDLENTITRYEQLYLDLIDRRMNKKPMIRELVTPADTNFREIPRIKIGVLREDNLLDLWYPIKGL